MTGAARRADARRRGRRVLREHHRRDCGNVTTPFDQLVGSYVPPRLDPAPVGSWSLPATYPHREVTSQLLSPMARHWKRLGLDGAPTPHTTMTERASTSALDAGET